MESAEISPERVGDVAEFYYVPERPSVYDVVGLVREYRGVRDHAGTLPVRAGDRAVSPGGHCGIQISGTRV